MAVGSGIVPSTRDERDVPPSQQGVLQELESHGYVAELQSMDSPDGTICRRPAGPNLLVRPDGRIELLRGQQDLRGRLSQPLVGRVHWGRGVLFLTLLGVTTFVGLLVVAMIVG